MSGVPEVGVTIFTFLRQLLRLPGHSTSRRRFLAGLTVSPLTLLPGRTRRPASAFRLADFAVAGFRYHDGPRVLARLRPGDRLRLVPEPLNAHDENAVRIEFEGCLLGYVPRGQNRTLSSLLRQGCPAACTVCRIDGNADPWEALSVVVDIAPSAPLDDWGGIEAEADEFGASPRPAV